MLAIFLCCKRILKCMCSLLLYIYRQFLLLKTISVYILRTLIGDIVNVRQNVNAYEWMKGEYVCYACTLLYRFYRC